MTRWFGAVLIGALMAGVSMAEQAPQLGPKSDLDAILDALHARGQNLKDFSADVTLTTVDNRTGAVNSDMGTVLYQDRSGNPRIRISFNSRKLESGATQKFKMDYVLADGWLTERNYQNKSEVKRQVLKPGEKLNLFQLGKGPFPLPIGQPRDEVKKQFVASKLEPAKDDPKDTLHVKLVPEKGQHFAKQFKQIDVFVDPASNWPVRIDADEKAGSTRTTELVNLKTNAGVADEAFALPDIAGQGWNRKEEPYAP